MKILWAKTDFLHPTTRGGQIRTLEMLRQLHRRHEVHYVALEDAANPEGVLRSSEYSTRAYPVAHRVSPSRSPRLIGQMAAGLFSPIPVSGLRYRCRAMRDTISGLLSKHAFDAKVCDFLFPSVNIEDLSGWVLFQHNVETIIWERHAQSGRTPLHRLYFADQARRMFEWERSVCRAVSHVVAVSEQDERIMHERFGIRNTSSVATGVDLDFFEKPAASGCTHDLVFVGSMDWMPNIDGIHWFLNEVLPIIRARKPGCRLAVVGRNPPPAITSQAQDGHITITGTVADVRPYLWQSAVSIVPLHVGGGTRLKIFEAMAAGTPVVSTTIGAEGLPIHHGQTIRIADTAPSFAAECLDLLEHPEQRATLAENALELIRTRFSWERVTYGFETTLRSVQVSAPQIA